MTLNVTFCSVFDETTMSTAVHDDAAVIISAELFGVRFHHGRYPQNLHNNIIYYVKKLEALDG